MKDVRGIETNVGDKVALAMRSGNIANFEFGEVVVIDEPSLRFRIRKEDGKISSWMRWYYHNIESQAYCKVLRLGP